MRYRGCKLAHGKVEVRGETIKFLVGFVQIINFLKFDLGEGWLNDCERRFQLFMSKFQLPY